MKVTRPLSNNPVISRQADRLVSTLSGKHQPRFQGPLLLGPHVGEDPGNEVG